MIKGFLIDIDGTLVCSNDAHAKAWETAFIRYGYTITYDEIRSLIGMGGDHILPALLTGLSSNHGIGKQIVEYRKQLFLENYAPNLSPAPGARELIQLLRTQQMRLILATSSSKEEISTLLEKAHVGDLIHEYVSAGDVGASKPNADIVAEALRKIRCSPHEAYLLGDTPYDIAAATKAHVRTIAVRTGGFSDEMLRGAIAIYDSTLDLIPNMDIHIKEHT